MKQRLKAWLAGKLTPEQVAGAHGRFLYSHKVSWWVDRSWVGDYAAVLEGDAVSGGDLNRILDRRFMLKECAEATRKLAGSTAECGVYRGVGSGIICTALAGTYGPDDYHFGFDSFEGLPRPSVVDQDAAGRTHWKTGDLAVTESAARSALAGFPFCRLVRGWLPDTLAHAEGRSFRLVHIDVDLYEPTKDVLEFFFPRMVRGGIILCDDYGMSTCPGSRKALDEFFADKCDAVIELTAGQGMVVISHENHDAIPISKASSAAAEMPLK